MIPNLELLREGGPTCPSDLALDQFCAHEHAQIDAGALESHAASCAVCAARLAERSRGFAAYPALDERKILSAIRRELSQPAPTRLGLGRIGALLGTVCAVVAIAFFVVRPPRSSGLRSKGGLALHVYRADGEGAQAMISGSQFSPGDELEFAIDLPRAGYVKVIGMQQNGSVYTAWPLNPAARSLFHAGAKIELPGAVALDGSLGREAFFLVRCPVSVGPPACKAGIKPGTLACPSACGISRFAIEKVP